MADGDEHGRSGQERPMCALGCGFFGNPATENMCSACFKMLGSLGAEADADMSDSVGFVEATSGRGIASGDVSMVEEVASMAASASAATVPDASAAVPPPAPSAEASAVAEAPSGEMSEAVDAAAPPVTPEPASGGAGADVVAPVAPTREKKKKRKKNRCATCRVKTGILGFVCRCDLNFCEKHRHPDDHECTFDAKAQHKAVLTKANNKVVAAKVDKI